MLRTSIETEEHFTRRGKNMIETIKIEAFLEVNENISCVRYVSVFCFGIDLNVYYTQTERERARRKKHNSLTCLWTLAACLHMRTSISLNSHKQLTKSECSRKSVRRSSSTSSLFFSFFLTRFSHFGSVGLLFSFIFFFI